MPRRSEIVMGFVLPPDSWRPEEASFLTQIVRRVGELSEPWLTFFTPNEISDHLMGLGFSHISHLTPEDAAARYFVNRHDGLRPPHYGRYVRAATEPATQTALALVGCFLSRATLSHSSVIPFSIDVQWRG